MECGTATRDLILLVLAGVALTFGLHYLGGVSELRLDWSDPIRWLSEAEPEAALAATLRQVGLVIGYWITISTSLYALAAGNRRIAPPRLVRLITLPGIRRLVDRAMATALTATIIVGPMQPALAEEPPPPPPAAAFDINTDGVPIPIIRLVEQPSIDEPAEQPTAASNAGVPAVQPLVPPTPQAVSPARASTPVAAATTSHRTATAYTVATGDSLWVIAERQLSSTDDLDTVSAYWRQLMAANSTTLRSGDPNLIYPGEIISLPPIEVSP